MNEEEDFSILSLDVLVEDCLALLSSSQTLFCFGCFSFEKTKKQSTCSKCQTVLTLSCYKCDASQRASDPPQVQSIAEKMVVEARSEEVLRKLQDYLSQATEQVCVGGHLWKDFSVGVSGTV